MSLVRSSRAKEPESNKPLVVLGRKTSPELHRFCVWWFPRSSSWLPVPASLVGRAPCWADPADRPSLFLGLPHPENTGCTLLASWVALLPKAEHPSRLLLPSNDSPGCGPSSPVVFPPFMPSSLGRTRCVLPASPCQWSANSGQLDSAEEDFVSSDITKQHESITVFLGPSRSISPASFKGSQGFSGSVKEHGKITTALIPLPKPMETMTPHQGHTSSLKMAQILSLAAGVKNLTRSSSLLGADGPPPSSGKRVHNPH